jgi:cell division protein FtsX
MQAQNTLYYSVRMQKNNSALFVCFSFYTVTNALTQAQTVTQRIAHCVATLQRNATSAQLAQVVAQQQQRNNAASVQCCTMQSAAQKLLLTNDNASY